MRHLFKFVAICFLIAMPCLIFGCGEPKTVELPNPADVPIEQLTAEEQMKVQALSAVDRDRSSDDDEEYAKPQ